jgi:RNA methyltransferase, TrmH family
VKRPTRSTSPPDAVFTRAARWRSKYANKATSTQNPRIKQLVKLRDDKKARKAEGLLLVEGWDEIQLAIVAGHKPHTLLSSPELASRTLAFPAAETLTLARPVFEKLAYRENPDGWLAVFPIPHTTLESVNLQNDSPLIILAESIEKPGNLGAMLRTADAAGVDLVLLCDPRADPWNPNVVRASRGTVFSVPTVECDSISALAWLKGKGIRVLATTPSASKPYTAVDLTQPVALALGTEDTGLSDYWMQNADLRVLIPMHGQINSLNVSVSTALIVYEALRQRGLT